MVMFSNVYDQMKERDIICRSIEYVDINDDGIRDWMKRLVSCLVASSSIIGISLDDASRRDKYD